ncbi:MAG: peptidylprolyl isomerase [Erythrobacter sp.]|uniref:peptidylprolyl isomerase n=1 Tax=Erythrobacter sp. TaxID=1042 RepID=UPI002B47ACDB|nr:peptidylprolyl isomerase [Erythrobacter sp.]WRH69208.1 MAG: peptidylprolyl isomerase [Erythrobacter sp.]
MTLAGWTREPLVHFLGLGALLYVVLTWGGAPPDPASRVIKVDAAQKAQLALGFERVMGRAPTDAELDERITRYVREEVLYREALRLGLDQDDAVVRQRMVAKMDLTAGGAAELAEPDEAALQAFYKANQARYARTPLVSFEQRLFSGEAAARAALSGAGGTGQPSSLPASMNETSMPEIAVRFGQQFAQGLVSLPADGAWKGPIPSGFGWHIVRVSGRASAEPDFEALRPRLANDWRADQIAQRKQRAYEILRSAYRVDISR